MKKFQLSKITKIILLIIISVKIHAQLGVNSSNSAPNAKAMLDVESADKGILIPRMSTTARNAIASPPNGLLIYNNTTNKFNYFDGTAWQETIIGNQWAVNGSNISYSGGNVGIGTASPTKPLNIYNLSTPSILFQTPVSGNLISDGFEIGANLGGDGIINNLEGKPISFQLQASEKMRVDDSGNIGIGAVSPLEKLDVNGNIRSTGNVVLTSGKVTRTNTGSANLVPIAFGSIQDNNAVLAGSGNWTTNSVATGHKRINIPGVSLNISTHTIVGSTSASFPVFTSFLIVNNNLEIFTYNSSGTLVNVPVSFVVYTE